MPQDTQNVPQWFSDFAVKNADEHGVLAKSISETKGDLSNSIADTRGDLATEIAKAETRLTRWTALLVIGGLTVAVSILTTIIILVN